MTHHFAQLKVMIKVSVVYRFSVLQLQTHELVFGRGRFCIIATRFVHTNFCGRGIYNKAQRFLLQAVLEMMNLGPIITYVRGKKIFLLLDME